ncbi:glycosyltransferase, partial [Escherichia coli]|nr:glycosyltransferase [Escherichia coli]
ATAAVARAHGATVLERHDPQRRGKGWTLRWALGQIGLERYDAVAMLDADNLAHPEFLERMNDYLEAHPEAEAVQGYLDTKNPDDSWVTRAIA